MTAVVLVVLAAWALVAAGAVIGWWMRGEVPVPAATMPNGTPRSPVQLPPSYRA